MKLGIMQPYFFPYLGYWQLIHAVDKYVIYDDVNYIKGGWINRNNILINGESKRINLRLYKSSPNKLINEIAVLDNKIYFNKLVRTIESNYGKAPYFYDVFPVIERIIMQDESNLAKYLEYQIREVCNYLSISTEIIISSNIQKNNELKGQEKVIGICKVLGANEYINAIGGQNLYTYEDFATQGILLRFLETKKTNYTQFKNDFIPNLSIIDVMMFNEPSKINEMLDNYEMF
jgi:hypothetical protein